MRKFQLLLGLVLFLSGSLLAQTRTVTGKVLDDQGNAIPGATVRAKGTNQGTATNTEGAFSLTVTEKVKALIVSYVGYNTVELPINGRSSLNFVLKATGESLSEVIVQVPYGTVKKTAFTGSEGTITAQTLDKQQVSSVTRAIEGLVPGVVTNNGGGAPGSDADVRIRGIGSYASSSSPLWVLDGMPYDGEISALNMDDIASVTVLKDAAATALYGSRAANGVIILTTKKGLKGHSTVTLNAVNGYQSRGIPEYDEVGPKDYYELMWEAIRNSYVYAQGSSFAAAGANASAFLTDVNHLVYNAYNVPGDQLVDPTTGKLNPSAKLLWNEPWDKALFRTAQRQNINLSIAGSGDKNDYLISLGYLNEDGILKFSGNKRYTARVNVNAEPLSWLKSGLNIDGAFANLHNLLNGGSYTSNPFYYSRNMGPIYPVYQHDPTTGAYVNDSLTGQRLLDWGVPSQMGARPFAGNSNLLGSLALDNRADNKLNGDANTYLEAKLPLNFSFRTTFGINYHDNYSTVYQNSQYGDAQNVEGRSTKQINRQYSYTFNQVLSWAKTINSDHNIKVLAGHENYKFLANQEFATRTGFAFPGSDELDDASVTETVSSYTDNFRIESYFSNLNYDYKDKYLFSASYRRDGTSRFAPSTRWGNFYSVGGGWMLTEEDFLKDATWINQLKLRVSYGVQGNQALQDINNNNNPIYYAYQSLYSSGNNNANYPGYVSSGVPSPGLKWEGNKTFDVGTDFTLFNKRLQGTVDFFNRISNNLLFGVPVPASTGNVIQYQNVGALRNRGIEVALGYNIIMKKDFDWRIDANFTHINNVFTKLPPGETTIPDITGKKQLQVGHSIYDWWTREFAGVDPATGDALFYKDVLDANGKATGKRTVTNVYSQGSYYYKGSSLPKFTGGVTNAFRYKNFDLSILVVFSEGGTYDDVNFENIMHPGTYGNAWASEIKNRWQKPGDITNVPRLQNGIVNQDGFSTRWLYDASWLNIKNVTLSYRIPNSTIRKAGINGIQIFGNVDNVKLFTAHKGMDPQYAFDGISDDTYTPYRTVSFGINLNL